MDSVPDMLQKLKMFKNQIHQMDQRVRLYVSDRKKYGHPFPEDLVNRIRAYETILHRYLAGFRNTELELWLDNLMYSLQVYEAIWKRTLEEDAQGPGMKRGKGPYPDPSVRSHPIVQKAFELEARQWSKLGICDTETEEELAVRILEQYHEASKNLKQNEKLVLSYDLRDHRVQIKVRASE